jgi:arylsulfatase A-like enzyme
MAGRTRREFLIGAAAAATGAVAVGPRSAAAQRSARSRRPNIVLVIADDFGIDASALHALPGAEGARKPVMSTVAALAAGGVVFDRCWVNPVCTPTRASIFTGQYGFRTKVLAVDDLLNPAEPTIFGRLKASGYRTAVIGKWHVGGNPAPLDHPARCGVDTFAGFMQGGLEDYFSWSGVEGRGAALRPFTTTTYATTWFANKAIAWTRAQPTSTPWMLALTFNAPHLPLHLPPAGLHRRTGLTGDRGDIRANPVEYFLAAAEALDTELGRVLASLSPTVRANTTVIFVGDNGTPRRVIQAPFAQTDGKGTVKAGGVHVPLVISGAGVTRRGVREVGLVNGVDLHATIAELASLPPVATGTATGRDSISVVPALRTAATPRPWIYSEHVRSAAATDQDSDGPDPVNAWTIRDDRWQLVRNELTGIDELYDLASDPGQRSNVAVDPAGQIEVARLAGLRPK